MTAKNHLPVLDGIRAIAVLMVICFHFWKGFSGANNLVGKAAVWGQTGVDLFFVLSGFLITGILLESKGSHHFLRNFYVRRILRIFPLYYATLLVIYLVGPLLHLNDWTPWKQQVWFWVYLQNILLTFAPSLVAGPNHFWSLAVEEHYYLFWPFLVMLLDRNRLLRAIGLAIAVSLLSRIVFWQYGTFYFTLSRLDGLAIGSALAIYARRPEGLGRFIRPAKILLCVLAPALAILQLAMSGQGLVTIQVGKNTLIALIYASVLVLAIENQFGRGVAKLLGSRVLGSVGKYSYAMYVFHPFLLSWLHDAGLPYGIFGLLVSILLTYLAAAASWMLVEKRVLRLKQYFEYDSSLPSRPFTSRFAAPVS